MPSLQLSDEHFNQILHQNTMSGAAWGQTNQSLLWQLFQPPGRPRGIAAHREHLQQNSNKILSGGSPRFPQGQCWKENILVYVQEAIWSSTPRFRKVLPPAVHTELGFLGVKSPELFLPLLQQLLSHPHLWSKQIIRPHITKISWFHMERQNSLNSKRTQIWPSSEHILVAT